MINTDSFSLKYLLMDLLCSPKPDSFHSLILKLHIIIYRFNELYVTSRQSN